MAIERQRVDASDVAIDVLPTSSRRCSVALLVLLPAAARARIVAADLRLVAPHRLDRRVVAADARRLRGAAAARRRGRRRCAPRGGAERRRRLGACGALSVIGGAAAPARPARTGAASPSSLTTGRSRHR